MVVYVAFLRDVSCQMLLKSANVSRKRYDTADTTNFCQRQLCYGLVVYVADFVVDLLRGNWCNGFWPSPYVAVDCSLGPEHSSLYAQPADAFLAASV